MRVCVCVCTIEWEGTFVDLNADTSVRINYKQFVWVNLNRWVSLPACLSEKDRGRETESGRESNLILLSVSPSIIAFPQETRWLHSTRDSVTACLSSGKQEPPQPNTYQKPFLLSDYWLFSQTDLVVLNWSLTDYIAGFLCVFLFALTKERMRDTKSAL